MRLRFPTAAVLVAFVVTMGAFISQMHNTRELLAQGPRVSGAPSSETKPGNAAAIGDTPALAARIKHIRKDRACAELLVERDLPRHPLRTNQTDGRFDAYRQAQARLIKSPAVLKAALADGTLAELAVIRDQPDALEFLDSHIEAHVPADELFIVVSFDGLRTPEAAAIVNAVARAFVDESANIESAAYNNRAGPLEKAHQELDEEMKKKSRHLRRLTTDLSDSDETEVKREYRDHVVKELAQARFALNRDRSRLAAVEAKAEIPAPDQEGLEAAIERRVEADPVSAAFIARKSIIRLLLTDGETAAGGRQPKQSAELERESALVDKALLERREELRAKVAKEFGDDAAQRPRRRRTELQFAISEREEWIKELQDDLARNRDQTSAWALDLEIVRKEIERIEKIDQEIVEQITRLKIDANAAPRVMLYRTAEAP